MLVNKKVVIKIINISVFNKTINMPELHFVHIFIQFIFDKNQFMNNLFRVEGCYSGHFGGMTMTVDFNPFLQNRGLR